MALDDVSFDELLGDSLGAVSHAQHNHARRQLFLQLACRQIPAASASENVVANRAPEKHV